MDKVPLKKLILGRTGKQFLRYYLLFFIFLVILFIPFYYINFTMVSRNYLDTAAALLETGLTNFENDLSQIEVISRNAFNNFRFRRFSYIGPEFNIPDYYSMITLVEDFRRYFASAGMIEDCGIVYSNDIVLTTKMLHLSGTEFYDQYFMQNDIPEYLDWVNVSLLSERNPFASSYLIPLASFTTSESSYSAITYVQVFSRFPQRTSFFFATLENNYILSRLATDEVLREGRVIMYDPSGIVLLDSSSEGIEDWEKDTITISLTGVRRGIRVTVDIPRQVITDKLSPFRNIAVIFSLLLILTGAVLSIFFAQRSSKPVREIMEEAVRFKRHNLLEEGPANFRNDFKYIQHFISQARWDYETFEVKLKQQEELQRENLFERLLHGLVYSTENYESVKSYLPDFPKKFRIAALALPGMEDAAPIAQTVQQTMLQGLIKSHIPSGGYIHFSGNTLVFFLPEEGQHKIISRLKNLADELQDKMNITGRIAMSEPIENIKDTYNAFYQVRHLLRLPRSITDSVNRNEIIQKENIPILPFSIELLDTSRLYELLLHAEEEMAVTFVNSMFYELSIREYTDENDIQQIFFLYRRILIQIVNELELAIEDTVIPAYDSREDISFLFAKIAESIRKICSTIKSRHDEANYEFEKSIIKFVDDNITNPNMYTKMVTHNFNIPENLLQNIFRRWMSKSFHEYVESKRMILAKEMLLKANKPISQITRDCGYSTENAFYKAFKRHYGLAPSELRH